MLGTLKSHPAAPASRLAGATQRFSGWTLTLTTLLLVATPVSPLRAQPILHEDCDRYADTAILQQLENIRKSCGVDGPAWSLDREHHYNWCVHGENFERFAPAEERRRAEALEACEEPPGEALVWPELDDTFLDINLAELEETVEGAPSEGLADWLRSQPVTGPLEASTLGELLAWADDKIAQLPSRSRRVAE